MVWSNKRRLVWDARELNKLIDVAELLEKNSYGVTSDLEAGYCQVGIAEETWRKRRSEEEMEDAEEGGRGPWKEREEFKGDTPRWT